ncbi:MAG: right-handed parallel beta-helix repeat-containing protein [Lentisphaeria bacterium]|nr:right-handed parallel beta-helix repeat-containing protein [Lentisphaeria bacterium]
MHESRTEPLALPTFDDAVAESVACFDVLPGAASSQRCRPRTTGSVRIVGRLRKVSADAEAECQIRLNGEAIWHRELGAEDRVPHAVDLLAHGLTEASEVEFVVTAAGKRVRVETAFQVVPEPYASRWEPDLPTGFPEWNETEREVLRRKGQEALEEIRRASAAGDRRIVIPPGEYLFHANWSRASTLRDLADLEIVAHDVTFWFEPPMVHALLFENCRQVTIRGLTIDFTIPVWFQARVTEIDHGKNTLDAVLMAGYAPRDANGNTETRGSRAFMFYDAQGRFINHRHTPGEWQLSEDGRNVLCREMKRHGIPGSLKPGDYVVGTIRTGAALRSVHCSGIRCEDVNIWSSPGIAVNEGGGEGGHVYHRVRATRRPGTNRLHAFGADVFHLAGTDRGPTLERCESAYSADDNLNIHGSFGRVVQRLDERRYFLQGVYETGDTLEFREMGSVELLGSARAAAVERTPEGPSLAINERYTAKGEYLVELDGPLDLPELSLVVLDGKRSAAGFVVRDCWFHSNFQRTLINGSPGGLIENTTLQNVGMGICVQFETWGPWMEGPFARDLVIRNNRFLDSPPDGPAISVSMHPPGGGSNRRRFDARPVTNMTITGNVFGRTEGPSLSIHNVDGLRIHGNSCERAPGDAAWIVLQDCDHVSIEGNHPPCVIPVPPDRDARTDGSSRNCLFPESVPAGPRAVQTDMGR